MWYNDLKIGQYFYVKTVEEIESEYGSLDKLPNYFPQSGVFDNRKFRVTDYILDNFESATDDNSIILVKDGYKLPLCVLKKHIKCVPVKLKEEKPENVEEKTKFDITCDEKDPEVIKEMISKVEFNTFKKLLQLGVKNKDIKDEYVMDYLNKWAKSKYEFYLMFGKNLSVYDTVQLDITPNEVRELVKQTNEKFPQYSLFLDGFSTEEILKNSCKNNPSFEKFYPKEYKVGMKFSKFLSKIVQDPLYDIEISRILQNKKVTGRVSVSIDPCDYMTMSIHKHSWSSCYEQINGCYSLAPYSVLCDDSTLIGFRDSGKKYNYSFESNGRKVEFEWNSKQTRKVVLFDKETGAIGDMRSMGNPPVEIENKIIDLVKNTYSKYKDIECNWKKEHITRNTTIIHSMHTHISDDFNYIIRNENVNSDKCKFTIGSDDIIHPVTGKLIGSVYKEMCRVV